MRQYVSFHRAARFWPYLSWDDLYAQTPLPQARRVIVSGVS